MVRSTVFVQIRETDHCSETGRGMDKMGERKRGMAETRQHDQAALSIDCLSSRSADMYRTTRIFARAVGRFCDGGSSMFYVENGVYKELLESLYYYNRPLRSMTGAVPIFTCAFIQGRQHSQAP